MALAVSTNPFFCLIRHRFFKETQKKQPLKKDEFVKSLLQFFCVISAKAGHLVQCFQADGRNHQRYPALSGGSGLRRSPE
jgi:hypothetical protein